MPTKTTIKATVEIEIEFKGDQSSKPDMDLIRKYVHWGADVKILQCNKQVVTTGPQIDHRRRAANQMIKHTSIESCRPYGPNVIVPDKYGIFHCYMGKRSKKANVWHYNRKHPNTSRQQTCLATFELDETTLQVEVTLQQEGLDLLKTLYVNPSQHIPAQTSITLCAYNHPDFPVQMAKVTDDIKKLWQL